MDIEPTEIKEGFLSVRKRRVNDEEPEESEIVIKRQKNSVVETEMMKMSLLAWAIHQFLRHTQYKVGEQIAYSYHFFPKERMDEKMESLDPKVETMQIFGLQIFFEQYPEVKKSIPQDKPVAGWMNIAIYSDILYDHRVSNVYVIQDQEYHSTFKTLPDGTQTEILPYAMVKHLIQVVPEQLMNELMESSIEKIEVEEPEQQQQSDVTID